MCGADPLNLVGGVLAGTTVPAVTGSRVLYRDGVPVAKLVAGEISLLETMDAKTENMARTKLVRGSGARYGIRGRRPRSANRPIAVMTQLGLFDAPLSLIDGERGSVTYRRRVSCGRTSRSVFFDAS